MVIRESSEDLILLRQIWKLVDGLEVVGFDENLWRENLIAGLCESFGFVPGPMWSRDDCCEQYQLYSGTEAAIAEPFQNNNLWQWLSAPKVCTVGSTACRSRRDSIHGCENALPSDAVCCIRLPGLRVYYCDSENGQTVGIMYNLPDVDVMYCLGFGVPKKSTLTEKRVLALRLVCREVYRKVIAGVLSTTQLRSTQPLSPREKETLRYILEGDSEKQIAHKLCLSPHTIHTYVKSLYKRFSVSSKGELMSVFIPREKLEATMFGWESLDERLDSDVS